MKDQDKIEEKQQDRSSFLPGLILFVEMAAIVVVGYIAIPQGPRLSAPILVFLFFLAILGYYLIYTNYGDHNWAFFWFIGICVVWSIIVFWVLSYAYHDMIFGDRFDPERRCKLTLKALGYTQSYFLLEHNGDYSTWEEMIDSEIIEEGYTRSNMIDNYSIALFDAAKSTRDEEGNSNFDSTFTIIAIPRSKKNRLRTFGICEDQKPRIWVGENNTLDFESINLRNLDQWEPVK